MRNISGLSVGESLVVIVLASACTPTPASNSSSSLSVSNGPSIEVVGRRNDVPTGADGAPKLTLAFRSANGKRIPIEGEVTSFAPFRDGVAVVDLQNRLLLITPDGTRRVLARSSGAPPVRGPRGELAYVSCYDVAAEVHLLQEAGTDRIVATGLASAGLLTPQPDGRLVFIGARNGGIAGVWVAGDESGARCLTNCDLQTGTPLGDSFIPLPESSQAIQVSGTRVQWRASDGTTRSVTLDGVSRSGSDTVKTTTTGDNRETGCVAPGVEP
jgi:hypothetical protein